LVYGIKSEIEAGNARMVDSRRLRVWDGMVLLLGGPYFFFPREFMRAGLGKLASAASEATYPILASYVALILMSSP
jgi:hypothetical protein